MWLSSTVYDLTPGGIMFEPASTDLFMAASLDKTLQSPNLVLVKPFPKRQILDSSKLKEFADDNFKFDNNSKKFPKREENTVGNREIATSNFSFPTELSKHLHCRQVKTKACLGKG